jgi:asparagine synthase (glutamine-hydrolysing)
MDRTRDAVEEMIAASLHRGPDTQACIEVALPDSALVLGHTRLSIMDLSNGSNQPMEDPETGSWLVFNGEIYNFRRLRRDLEWLGAKFHTSGDTEVLLQGLLYWGERVLDKLEGMFAFAFWDGRRRELLLARDPLGIKPLYYCSSPSRFAFASEAKVLARAGICSRAINQRGLASFLAYGAVIGPDTIYSDVQELEPGHKIRVNARYEVADSEYWNLSHCLHRVPTSNSGDFGSATLQIEHCLDRAVASHLIGDVPVGVFLSGGIDSSLLALTAANYSTSPLTLLTVAFPECDFSELTQAQEIARKLPFRHEVIMLDAAGLHGVIPDALTAMDQPTVDGINTFIICQAGAELGLKVLLTGIGGDELFGGYTTFSKVPALRNYGRVFRPLARILDRCRTDNPIQWKKLSEADSPRDTIDAYLLQRSIRWNLVDRGSLRPGLAQIESFDDDFQKVASLELQFYTRNQLLRDADVFSMANSVELRVPFLDLGLLRAALSLGPEYHFEGTRGKRLTRHILGTRSGTPFSRRRKQGFSFPWREWLRSELKPTIIRTLRDSRLYDSLALDPCYGEALLAALDRDDPRRSWSEVWSLFVLLSWQSRNEVSCGVA